MNQHYLQFSVEDFIADEAFQQWVLGAAPETDRAWRKWFNENPAQTQIAEIAASFITNLRFNTISPAKTSIQASLGRNLQNIAQLESMSRRAKRRRIRVAIGVGLAILVATVAGWFSYQSPGKDQPVLVELQTGPGEVRNVLLPDSSIVTINENSSVTYASSFQSRPRREVWMKGEVFFNVKHIEPEPGKAKQFLVYSGDIKVEVLGTAFNVKSYGSVTNVSLNTGQIKIGVKDDPVSVTLQPGDFIQYSGTQKKLVKRQVDAGLYSTWKEKKLKLDKMPMQKISQLITDIYGYKVEITEPALRASQISGTLLVNDEQTFLETLSFALDIDIKKNDSTLTFTSKSKIKEE